MFPSVRRCSGEDWITTECSNLAYREYSEIPCWFCRYCHFILEGRKNNNLKHILSQVCLFKSFLVQTWFIWLLLGGFSVVQYWAYLQFKLTVTYNVWRVNAISYPAHIFDCSLPNEIAVLTLIPAHLLSVRIPLSFCFIVRFIHQKCNSSCSWWFWWRYKYTMLSVLSKQVVREDE